MDAKKVLEKIKVGTITVTPENELIKKFKKNIPLNIKLGCDPTAPDLHLGHAVVLSKLRQFQDFGHNITFVIGDFTAKIGDPSGRSKTRPALTEEEIEKNAQTYLQQVNKILDPQKTSIRYNSEWLSQISLSEMINIAGKITLARLIEREDFQNRLKSNAPIGFHELFYPILQGYDSVALKADVELGGTDQTFNLLMGRDLQEQYNQEQQVIVTVPLLEGLDGVQKMSKSYNNYVGLWEEPSNAYGKLMSISDKLMWRYYSILLHKTDTEIASMQEAVVNGNDHPMKLKKDLSYQIIQRFWSQEDAIAAAEKFELLFQKQDYTRAGEVTLPQDLSNPVWIVTLLKTLGATKTSSEAKRLIESHAVLLDGTPVKNFKDEVIYKDGMIVKVGKHRIYKIKTP